MFPKVLLILQSVIHYNYNKPVRYPQPLETHTYISITIQFVLELKGQILFRIKQGELRVYF